MRRKDLARLVLMVVTIYSLAIIGGLIILIGFPDYLSKYMSLVPFIVAIPAAILTSGFQRRSSYIKTLQGVWPGVVKAGRSAIDYTYIKNPNYEQFNKVILSL